MSIPFVKLWSLIIATAQISLVIDLYGEVVVGGWKGFIKGNLGICILVKFVLEIWVLVNFDFS